MLVEDMFKKINLDKFEKKLFNFIFFYKIKCIIFLIR